ncbi:beta/alpha barrel domain-containing protein [Roseimaritima ulvae]|uniref:Dihydroorotate dehydrogenase B (NAD(+)), catalytic subunit n=1 Tax=Roseimaritima ulvae TaxID=980254 RepID=A0A5B9QP37_9BACT|nr:hypothetical protein [Roseimaritima ulvae]QEG39662.1 Dihydroorotate dehydrogenase B (NAD(+)), catalytic subunit [Roseimaritima ulvae]
MSLNLSVCYGGLFLESPIVVGACPITTDDQTRTNLEIAGAGAIVLPSLFEEQVIAWTQKLGQPATDRDLELVARSKRLNVRAACRDADTYLALVNRAGTMQSIPIIASMNGYSHSGWLDFAGELQAAGAAGIEINIHGSTLDYRLSPNQIEDAIVGALAELKQSISVPLFVKLQPAGISIPHLARRSCSGTDGMVLYGRSPVTDICLDSLRLKSTWNLTEPGSACQLLEPLMEVHAACPSMSLAASGGIASTEDVLKVFLAGADVAMVTSELYRSGPSVVRQLLDGLTTYLEHHQFQSLLDLQLHRPLKFDSDEARELYTEALAARVCSNPSKPAYRNVYGDRWGHPTAS